MAGATVVVGTTAGATVAAAPMAGAMVVVGTTAGATVAADPTAVAAQAADGTDTAMTGTPGARMDATTADVAAGVKTPAGRAGEAVDALSTPASSAGRP
jgi:hypothetical protein